MKRALLSLTALAFLAVPAQADTLTNIANGFAGGSCSLSSLSCTAKFNTTLHHIHVGPYNTGSTGPFPSFNSKGRIGFWDSNDNIDISKMIHANNPPSVTSTDDPACKTKTGQLHHTGSNPLNGWTVSVSESTGDGACPHH